MGIGGISGLSNVYSYYPGYSVSSINANPVSLRRVERIGEDTEKSKPFAILKKDKIAPQVDAEKEPAKQTMTVANDYKNEMARMMSGVKFSAESLANGMVGA